MQRTQLRELVEHALALHARQRAQAHVEDRLRLAFGEAGSASISAAAGARGRVLGRSDEPRSTSSRLIEGDLEAFEDVGARFRLLRGRRSRRRITTSLAELDERAGASSLIDSVCGRPFPTSASMIDAEGASGSGVMLVELVQRRRLRRRVASSAR